jgi:DNA-binding response OmpR family regulator
MAVKKILCIEDDRFIGEMYVRSLKKAGYEVDWEVDGDEGLAAARNNNYDLILLDIMLPARQGIEILNSLRGKEDLIPNSKIIIMTNFEQDEDERQEAEKKVDAYLIKAEITPGKLLEIVEKI